MKKFFFCLALSLLMLVGCIVNNSNTSANCSMLNGILKRDECYANMAESVVINDIEEGKQVCILIKDLIIRDACLSNIFEKVFGIKSDAELNSICVLMNDPNLRDNCERKVSRHHLRGVIK